MIYNLIRAILQNPKNQLISKIPSLLDLYLIYNLRLIFDICLIFDINFNSNTTLPKSYTRLRTVKLKAKFMRLIFSMLSYYNIV